MSIKFEIPKFDPEKDDAELWLYRYEKDSRLNNWSKDIRLQYVDNCFNYEMQLWYMRNKFSDWEKFKSNFLQMYGKKIDLDQLTVQIISIKMHPREGIHHYFNRFELLHDQYIQERMKHDNKQVLHSQNNVSSSSETNEAAVQPLEESDDEDNFSLTEREFVKHFINGIASVNLRRLLRGRKLRTMEETMSYIEELQEGEEYLLDEETTLVVDETVKPILHTKNTNQGVIVKSNKTKTEDDVANIVDTFKNMTMMLSEFINNNTKTNSKAFHQDTKKKITCWNCKDTEHKTPDYNKPCKLCGSKEHVHYQCGQYKSSKQTNEFMLIEEMLVSEKRKMVDNDTQAVENKRLRDSRVNRSGNNYDTTPKRRMTNTVPEPLDDQTQKSVPITQNTPKTANEIANKQTKKGRNVGTEQEVEKIVDHILDETSHKLSLRQIGILSAPARSRIKTRLTKSHAKIPLMATTNHNLLTEVYAQDENDRTNMPKCLGAPRTVGTINGQPCEIILDGGSTGCIVSKKLAIKIGLTEAEPTNIKLMFGDGSFVAPIGVINGLQVAIVEVDYRNVSALCLDVGDRYESLIGRQGLYDMKIGTDWAQHYWYISTSSGELPIEVHYRTPFDEESTNDDDSELSDTAYQEGFLIIEDYDEDKHKSYNHKSSIVNNDRISTLIEQISSYDNIDTETKEKLIVLINKYEDCFGTNYSHLSTTN
ncbi:hypothetical protein A0J61_10845, partial [Choanephora cucurbitarum]